MSPLVLHMIILLDVALYILCANLLISLSELVALVAIYKVFLKVGKVTTINNQYEENCFNLNELIEVYFNKILIYC